MPWKESDAQKKTRLATTPRLKRIWKRESNSVLSRTGDEGRAIRAANAAVRIVSERSAAKRVRERSAKRSSRR